VRIDYKAGIMKITTNTGIKYIISTQPEVIQYFILENKTYQNPTTVNRSRKPTVSEANEDLQRIVHAIVDACTKPHSLKP
jgi:hypothetical protein